MKNLSLFIFVFSMAMQGLSAQVDLSNGLIAYYPCNNSGDDHANASVGPYNLVKGADLRSISDRFGHADAAFEYTNNESNANLSGAINFSEISYSVAVWMRQDSTTQTTGLFRIFGEDPAEPTHYQTVRIELQGSGSTGTLAAAEHESVFGLQGCNSNSTVSSDPNIIDLQDGAWHLITLTRVNDSLRLYVDTVLTEVRAQLANACNANPPSQARFGGQGLAAATIASFDDMMVYNRAINAQEVAAIYNLTAAYSNSAVSNDMLAKAQTSFRIFPNPTQSELTVTLEEIEAEQYRIYNSLGQLVDQGQFIGQQQQINTAGLNAGFYQLVLQTTKGQQLSQQFIKQ